MIGEASRARCGQSSGVIRLYRTLFRRKGADRALRRLERYGIRPERIVALQDLIACAEDRELYQANPRYLVRHLELDERATLDLLLAGVSEGLFDLAWQVRCPSCSAGGTTTYFLGEIPRLHHCYTCGHEFEAHLDSEITVIFSVNERLRPLSPTRRDDPEFRAAIDARLGPTPALALIHIPAFQRLLADQLLPEGQSLGVKRLTVFFSDLRGSTAFYHRRGDAEAYYWVREHFAVVFDAVAGHGGRAVKTMGDGVMGVFSNPATALRAVTASFSGLDRLNARAGLTGDDRLVLKVGLHAGPCIVVTLNGQLDYFGRTVNLAARLSALSTGHEVVLTNAVLDDLEARELVRNLGVLVPTHTLLPGFPESPALYRLIIPPLHEPTAVPLFASPQHVLTRS